MPQPSVYNCTDFYLYLTILPDIPGNCASIAGNRQKYF